MPLHKAMFLEPNPTGPKYALAKLGKMQNALRSPMVAGRGLIPPSVSTRRCGMPV